MSDELVGERCRACVEDRSSSPRPVWAGGLCLEHWRESREAADGDPYPPATLRFDTLVAIGGAFYADDPRFDDELTRWFGGGDLSSK